MNVDKLVWMYLICSDVYILMYIPRYIIEPLNIYSTDEFHEMDSTFVTCNGVYSQSHTDGTTVSQARYLPNRKILV